MSDSTEAATQDCHACAGTGCRLGPDGCNGRQHAFIGCSTCIACRGTGSVPDLMAALEQSVERARAARRSESTGGAA